MARIDVPEIEVKYSQDSMEAVMASMARIMYGHIGPRSCVFILVCNCKGIEPDELREITTSEDRTPFNQLTWARGSFEGEDAYFAFLPSAPPKIEINTQVKGYGRINGKRVFFVDKKSEIPDSNYGNIPTYKWEVGRVESKRVFFIYLPDKRPSFLGAHSRVARRG